MTNPYVTRPAEAPVAPVQPVAAANPYLMGPTQPQRGIPGPEAVDRLARRTVDRIAPAWWVGAHGGSGESMLRRAVGLEAAGHAWPIDAGGGRTAAIIVCRSHPAGLEAAQRAAIEWSSGQVPSVELLGLVVVADAPGHTPKPLRQFRTIVAGAFPRSWSIPWSEGWRFGQTEPNDPATRAAVRVLADLNLTS